MKQHLLRVFVILVLASNAWAQPVTMTIAYEDKAQPPYYLGDANEVPETRPGVAVEMVKALESKVPGLRIRLTRAPWKRCTTELGSGAYDGIFNASYHPDRLSIGRYPTLDGTRTGAVDPSKRITTISYALYVLKTSKATWDGRSFRDLEGLVGAPLGYSIVGDLRALGVTVHEVPGTRNALDMVISGRIAGAALQEVSADALIRAFPDRYGRLRKAPKLIASKPYYLMLSNRFVEANPEMALRIWAALERTRERELKPLITKYQDLKE